MATVPPPLNPLAPRGDDGQFGPASYQPPSWLPSMGRFAPLGEDGPTAEDRPSDDAGSNDSASNSASSNDVGPMPAPTPLMPPSLAPTAKVEDEPCQLPSTHSMMSGGSPIAKPEAAQPEASQPEAPATEAVVLPPTSALLQSALSGKPLELPQSAAANLPPPLAPTAFAPPVATPVEPQTEPKPDAEQAEGPLEDEHDWSTDEDDEDFDIEYSVTPAERLREIMPQWFRYQGRAAHGTIVSIMLHVAALLLVANSFMIVEHPEMLQALTWIIEPEEEELEIPEPELTLAPPSDEPSENVMASIATSAAPTQSEQPEMLRDLDDRPLVDPEVFDLPQVADFSGLELNQIVHRPGAVGLETVHVDGAVDRITYEIASRLETEPVLVIWLMDASISLVDDRQMVADRLEKVFGELDKLDNPNQRSLLSAVVSFGNAATEMAAPTGDGRAVVEAIRNVPVDETGVENVFQTVAFALRRYKPLITFEQRKPLVVIWTDESGDDYAHLEDAVGLCHTLSAPVFTVGPSAMFGREMGTHAYKNPEDGITYMLPVNRGPDAVHQERIRAPFWFEGDQHEVLHSGLGSFALTRLAVESGGAYFINDQEEDASPFRLEVMREFLPDYSSVPEYVQKVNASPLRRAIMQSVVVTHKETLKGTPRLLFEPTGTTYITELADAQKSAAFNLRILEMALSPFGPKGMESEYEKETSKRWKAWYDLTYGRLLAMTVRNNEYNWACAEMKRKGAEFVNDKSNRWRFTPDPECRMSSINARTAAEATRLLKRCVEQNPNTPWAVLAQRELKDGLGFVVEEHYVAPPPPPPKRVATPNPNPPPPPPQNPPPKRTEKPKMIPRPPEVKLPKL